LTRQVVKPPAFDQGQAGCRAGTGMRGTCVELDVVLLHLRHLLQRAQPRDGRVS
jgi:hypothetical protein